MLFEDNLLNPVQVVVYPGVHSRSVWSSTKLAKGSDAHDKGHAVVFRQYSMNGSTGIALTGVLAAWQVAGAELTIDNPAGKTSLLAIDLLAT